MGKMDEMILVVLCDDVFKKESLIFQGVNSEDSKVVEIMVQIEVGYCEMRRGDVEEDLYFKQLIFYVVIKCEDEVFFYEWLVGGGELCLYNKFFFGFGGYMNLIEGVVLFVEVLKLNIDCEFDEEL